jgi:two-component system OmpR family sensor kinase
LSGRLSAVHRAAYAVRTWRPRRWSHWTLRSRLALVVGVLAAIALIIANIAGVLLIRSYLRDRIDDQLVGMTRPFSKAPLRTGDQGTPPRARVWRGLGPDQVAYFYGPDGALNPARSSTTDAARPSPESFAAAAARATTRHPYTVAARDGSAPWRMIAVRNAGNGDVAVIGISLSEMQETTDRLILIDLAVTVFMLALLGAGAAFVVRLGLRPLTDMEKVAAEISAGNLSERPASEQRLRQFVADASHELRTPLTSIRGFAELYRRGGAPPGPALDETMSRIEGEAGRMGVLVEDMLMLARLDRQRSPARRPVDLLEIAADTVRDAHARVPDRPVKLAGLSDDADTFEPATVLGDEHSLRQVATNLVANALQHTPPQARVTIRVGRLPARAPRPASVRSGPAFVPPGTSLAVFEVTDDGPGVPQAHAPRVFERLYRADSSRTRGRGGGSGLGLSIVAAIVHGHGGWVELDEPRGGGATFRVLLPASGDSP